MTDSYYQYLEDEALAELDSLAHEKHIACVNVTATAERLQSIRMEATLEYIRDFKIDPEWSAPTLRFWLRFLQDVAAKQLEGKKE